MFRLSMARGNRWLVLPHGVKVEVRPLTTAMNQAAVAGARKRVAVMTADAEAAEKAGMPMDPRGQNGANAAWLNGFWTQCYAEELALYGITRWEGIRGDDGEILEVSPAAIVAFVAHPALGNAFVAAYEADLAEQVAEGNASTASVSGDTAAETTPAETAPVRPAGRASKAAPAAVSDAEPAPAS